MTQRLVLPYLRGPNHIPRRDLVLGGADSMALEVAIIRGTTRHLRRWTLPGAWVARR